MSDKEYQEYMRKRQEECPEHNYCETFTIELDGVPHQMKGDPNKCTRCGKIKFDDIN